MNPKTLVRTLGPGWSLGKKGAITHEATQVELVPVPGGTFVMGFTIDDILSIMRAVGDDRSERRAEIPIEVERARPAHAVAIRPFLAARTLVRGEVKGSVARSTARKAGLRLLSEAEWEWIAREGGAGRFTGVPRKKRPVTSGSAGGMVKEGPNAFGIADLNVGAEWVADAWHPTYAKAPGDGRSWGDAAGVTRVGHVDWQDPIEVVSLHAAVRARTTSVAYYRLAADVPKAPKPKAPRFDIAGSMRETLAVLASGKPALAIATIDLVLALRVEQDTKALVSAVLKAWPKLREATRRELAAVFVIRSSKREVKALLTSKVVQAAMDAARTSARAKPTTKPGAAVEGQAPASPQNSRPDSEAWDRLHQLVDDPACLDPLSPDARERRLLDALAPFVAHARVNYMNVSAADNARQLAEGAFPKCPTMPVARALLAYALSGYGQVGPTVALLAQTGGADVQRELARYATIAPKDARGILASVHALLEHPA